MLENVILDSPDPHMPETRFLLPIEPEPPDNGCCKAVFQGLHNTSTTILKLNNASSHILSGIEF